VLYVNGELGDVDGSMLVAVVGSRQITEYGNEAATRLSVGLASHGAVIVSGLALGVDTAAHTGALKGGGKTIAVIGCGLDIDYPASNRELRRLIASNGAIVSEYQPGLQFPGSQPHNRRPVAWHRGG
jgi:DNA processing protein